MKSIIKFLLGRLGYRFAKVDFYENWVNIDNVSNLDFYYSIKNLFSKDRNICCFDIGANIGQTSKKLCSYFPNSTIYCFEPVGETYKLLEKNVREHSNIQTFNLAMGASAGEAEIFHRANSEWNSLVKSLNENAKNTDAVSEVIKVDTIDNFVKEKKISKIDFLKSDTEGFEMEVLRGAKYCLENQLIDMIYVEVGFSKMDSQHTYFNRLMEELENYHFGFSGLFEKSYTKQNTILYANALFIRK
jgi:FkbM family methyltransferase